jgi:mono/diheme cytochrome c family protein
MARWVKRLMKIAGTAAVILMILAALAITFTVGWRPIIGAKARPLTARKFDATPERLKRGEYLARGVAGCLYCHSDFDEKSDNPVLLSKEGAGRLFAEEGNFLLVIPNITPDKDTGIGLWSDDAIARAVREGIGADGRVLFPIMPYEAFRHLSDEDLAAVIVYIRSLEPARSTLPKTKLPFMLSRLIYSLPQPVTSPVPQPDMSTPAKRGEYLARIGFCAVCHTPESSPPIVKPIRGMEMAGGTTFGDVASANLTPDASGISYYDEAFFIEVIRTGHAKARAIKPPMPWRLYRNMTDEDLKAVFAYLRTLKPVHHRVDNDEPRTKCRLCGETHGLGDRN